MANNSSDPPKMHCVSGVGHFPSSDQGFEPLADAVRVVVEAQFDYRQALLRANAALFSVWFDQPVRVLEEERPSVAARESYFAQPEFIPPEFVER